MSNTSSSPNDWKGFVDDWSGDQEAFRAVPWGKAMMWIFLLSDTFIFGSFLTGYMTVRASTTVAWPNPSEVFALTVAGVHVPLLLIAIMTFVLITSSGTMAMAVNCGYRRDRRNAARLMVLTAVLGAMFVVAFKVNRGDYEKRGYQIVEITGLYWHFVDLVWVFIFAFFYLW
jgi:cytochrome c oxidase subunit 3